NASTSAAADGETRNLAAELEAVGAGDDHDGYASSTHTDTDAFEDAADGSHPEDETEEPDSSLSVDTTPRPSITSFPEAQSESTPEEPPTESASAPIEEQAEKRASTGEENLAASSSSATFVGQETDSAIRADLSRTPEAKPLSSAEIRDSQDTFDSLILDEESAKATLPDQVEKVPPSIGATSMLEPEETISNPFATNDEDDAPGPRRFSSDAMGRNSVVSSVPPDTPDMSSNHFSVVSLSSTTASGTDGGSSISNNGAANWTDMGHEKRNTITIGTPTSAAAGSAVSSPKDDSLASGAVANYDFLLARLENQNNRLTNDPKAIRASLDGAVKLRENFEKLRDQGQRRSRTESQNRGLEDGVAGTTNGNGAGHDSSAGNGASTHHHQREASKASTTDTSEAPWDGPPVEEIAEEAIDWEFWGDVMSNYQQVARNQPRQLSRAIQAGIPAALRGMMWQLMSSSKNEEMEIIYAYYLKQTSSHEKAIRRDLNRTFPEQDYFQDGKGIGQENLFNVIKAYSLYDPEVGYCQGMQFIVGPLLLNMPDEEAFSTFVRLMKSYDLRGHFTPNMPALQLRLFQFDRLLEDFLPLLFRHLTRQGVKSSMYASQWFMTLFSYRFPLDLVYRVLDSVFAEGVEALFRFAIALMRKNEERLLELPFDQAVNFLKLELFECYRKKPLHAEGSSNGSESRKSTGLETENGEAASSVSIGTPTEAKPASSEYRTNEFVRDAFQIKITPFMLDGYASEFDQQVRAANAHRREVEALRLVNRNLAARVKALEDQLNSVNAEHVEMVKDVVMAKIAKEEMAEELVRYKVMYAEAVLQADQESPNHRGSA
ncbi:hypothetical protein BCV70DRAFT_152642, partial [Testicularia cyperi]